MLGVKTRFYRHFCVCPGLLPVGRPAWFARCSEQCALALQAVCSHRLNSKVSPVNRADWLSIVSNIWL